jgi:hypothetical protein
MAKIATGPSGGFSDAALRVELGEVWLGKFNLGKNLQKNNFTLYRTVEIFLKTCVAEPVSAPTPVFVNFRPGSGVGTSSDCS